MTLTKSNPDGKWCVIGSDGEEIPWKDIPNELYGALCKLYAYERSELSPETVETLRDENKRLCAANRRLKSLVDELESVLKGSGENG